MPRRYVPLAVDFLDDDRIIESSQQARYVYMVGLTIAGKNERDGEVSLPQVQRACFDVDGLDALIEELVTRGLWQRRKDGRTFVIPSWLQWNRSAKEIEAIRQKNTDSGRKGGRRKPPVSEPLSEPLSESVSEPLSESGAERQANRQANRQATDRQTDSTELKLQTDLERTVDECEEAERASRRSLVVDSFVTRAAKHYNGKSPAAYKSGIRRNFQAERGDELDRLLSERPSARIDQIVDLLESDGNSGYSVNGIPQVSQAYDPMSQLL
jgi:hypothetical protein